MCEKKGDSSSSVFIFYFCFKPMWFSALVVQSLYSFGGIFFSHPPEREFYFFLSLSLSYLRARGRERVAREFLSIAPRR